MDQPEVVANGPLTRVLRELIPLYALAAAVVGEQRPAPTPGTI